MEPASTHDAVDAIFRWATGGDPALVEALGRLTVVVIEPDRHARALLRGLMKAYGFRNLVECDDTAQALRVLHDCPVDLVLTEFAVDPADGISFVQVVRASVSPNRMVPIVMYTDCTECGLVQAARDAGIDEFVVKPVSADALYARLNAALFTRRPFVRTMIYFGPDRRRHRATAPPHPNRRHTRPDLIAPPTSLPALKAQG